MSTPPSNYEPQPGDPSPPYPVLTVLRANNYPLGSHAVLECPNPSTQADEPHWTFFFPG